VASNILRNNVTVSPATRQNFCARLFCDEIWRDMRSYMLEYSCPAAFANGNEVRRAVRTIENMIVAQDVVLFIKPGCGFCIRAKALLADQRKNVGFTLEEADGTSQAFRAALAFVTQAYLSFPVVFVRGSFIGGADDLRAAITAGKFTSMLVATQTMLMEGRAAASEDFLRRQQRPNLLHVPRGGRWFCPQLYTYSNFVRGISALHCAILGVQLLLVGIGTSGANAAADVLALYFLLELSLYVLLGPAPFCPLGCVVAYFLWRYRGNSVTTIPYKFIFIVYIVSIVESLASGKRARDCRSMMISGLINSSLLAVLRF